MVEVVVDQVARQPDATGIVVVLKEKEGPRALPIQIGPHEAHAILLELKGIVCERPLTHDLVRNMLQQLQVQVARVMVTELRDQIYYALMVLVSDGHEEQVDARPSDAIALALRAGAPIYVADELMRLVEEGGAGEGPGDVAH